MPYLQFDKSLLFGERAQDRVSDLLRMAGAKCDKKDGRDKYDFEAIYQNHVFRVEVKNEDNYAASGNICIELCQRDPYRPGMAKPSGLAWSEATVCVHTLREECAIYRSRDMREYLRQLAAHKQLIKKQFGDNENQGCLVRVKVMNFPWFDFRPLNLIAKSPIWLA